MLVSPIPTVVGRALTLRGEDTIRYYLPEQSMLKEVVTQRIVEALRRDEHILIVVPKWMAKGTTAELLKSYRLQQFVYETGTEPSEIGSALLPSLTKEQYANFKMSYRAASESLTNALASIYAEIRPGQTVKSCIYHNQAGQFRPYTPDTLKALLDLNLNEEEIEMLGHLQNIYQARYEYIDHCDLVDKSALLQDQTFVIDEVTHIAEQLTAAQVELRQLMDRDQKQYPSQQAITTLREMRDHIQDAISDMSIVHDDFPYATWLENIIQKLEQYEFADIILKYRQQGQQLSTLIELINQEIAFASSRTKESHTTAEIRLYDLPNQAIEFAVNKVITTLRLINRSKAIKGKFQTKFLHLSHLLRETEKAIAHVSLALKVVTDAGYIEYLTLTNQLSLTDDQWSTLLSYQSDWREILSKLSEAKTFHDSITPELGRLDESYTQYTNATQALKHATLRSVYTLQHTKQKKALSSSENYNSLDTDLQWQLYPIHIIHEHELPDHESAQWQDLDAIMTVETDATAQWLLQRGGEYTLEIYSTKKVSDGDYFPPTTQHIKSLTCAQDLFTTLTKLDTSSRYQASVKLANNLMSIGAVYQVYKLGTTAVCSFAHPKANLLIEDGLALSHSHVLYSDAQSVNALIEAMIHYDDVKIIIENGLIDDTDQSNIDWQKKVLGQCESAGISILSLDTYQAYIGLDDCIDTLCAALTPRSKSMAVEV